ncbi:hypothetical protein, partial [Nocardia farcinica]|uniref:hypothetical protein n=1 Tax=Nocardia farcinica TaxID=37329 RepID=UPI0024543EED
GGGGVGVCGDRWGFWGGGGVYRALPHSGAAPRGAPAPLPFRPWALAPETGLRRRPERSPFWCGVVRMRRADEAV